MEENQSKFHQRFRELVEKSSMDAPELCSRWDISRYQFYNWINGRGRPDFEKLMLIRKTFDVSYEYLFGESDNPSSPNTILHPKAKELLDEYRDFLIHKYPLKGKD